MPFNSYEFLFLFLPVALGGYYVLSRLSRGAALGWLIIASIGFYAWWRPLNLLIIAPSILANYAIARVMLRSDDRAGSWRRRLLLIAGIAFNVLFLGWFKYAGFIGEIAHDAFGADWLIGNVVLPLGISFITFQKIAFLVDVHAGRIPAFSIRDYCLFVFFFPQLIAGPIVHYREMMPQFKSASPRPVIEDAVVGITLLAFGLAKKVFLADTLGSFVTPLYAAAGASHGLSLVPAWLAALGFTLQIYFDFSGYSDMALGLARFFGIKLPPNFDSPLRATSIIDFWLRWHMSLTRFLTAYVYNPLVLWLTRRRAAQGRPILAAGRATPGAFLWLLLLPTLVTMLVSGVWHGAGYTFLAWGALHGVYLGINHAFRRVRPRLFPDRARYDRWMRPVGFLLTFVAVVAGMVLFRAPTVAVAGDILAGMAGLRGVDLPPSLLGRLGPLAAAVGRIGLVAGPEWPVPVIGLVKWTVGLLGLALLMPNTLTLLSAYEPALGVRPRTERSRVPSWQPTLAWATGIAIVAALAAVRLGGRSEFLYWQF